MNAGLFKKSHRLNLVQNIKASSATVENKRIISKNHPLPVGSKTRSKLPSELNVTQAPSSLRGAPVASQKLKETSVPSAAVITRQSVITEGLSQAKTVPSSFKSSSSFIAHDLSKPVLTRKSSARNKEVLEKSSVDSHALNNLAKTAKSAAPTVKPAVKDINKIEAKPQERSEKITNAGKDLSKSEDQLKETKPLRGKQPNTRKKVAHLSINADESKPEVSLKAVLDNIHFHYPTFSSTELQEQGIFDEFTESNFLPPLIIEPAVEEPKEIIPVVVEEEHPPPDTLDGVCIFGF